MPSYPAIKLNLINKAKARAAAKAVWLIAKKQDGVSYYLADFDEDTTAALWCRNRSQAITFLTEQHVYQYIAVYLNNRNDIYLVYTGGI